jgi:hypothetical protein
MSGDTGAVTVTVSRGSDTVQDIFLDNSAEESGTSPSHDFSAPQTIPGGGVWMGTLQSPGETEYYRFTGRQDRVATFEVRAVGEDGQASQQKAMPVLGIWDIATAEGSAPAIAATYFNSSQLGLSQLKAQFTATGGFTLGVADYRGDGRPDFRYQGRVFYADTVEPDRANTAGGTVLTIRGTGFIAGMTVTIDGAAVPIKSFTSEEIQIVAPPHTDGVVSIDFTDPATNAQAQMLNALRYGAAPQDILTLVSSANPQVPVGTEAPFPIAVRVTGSDGLPVSGASVRFTSGSSVLLLPCGSTSCTLATDQTGEASATVLVQSAGIATITATLASGASVSGTVNGISPALAISALPSSIYMAQSSSGSVMLHARVVANGAAASGRTVTFQLLRGQGTLSTTSVVTNSLGDASSTLTVTSIASQITVGACVPSTSACTTFNIFPVAQSGLVLQKISGDGQYAVPGGSFAPLMVRVLDSSIPGKPVAGVPVLFHVSALRQGQSSQPLDGEVISGRFAGPVVVSSSDTTVLSDSQGVASFAATAPANEPGVQIDVQASAAGVSQSFILHSWPGTSIAATLPQLGSGSGGVATSSQTQPTVSSAGFLAARMSSVKSSAMLVAVPEIPGTIVQSSPMQSSLIPNSSKAKNIVPAGVPVNPVDVTIQAISKHMPWGAGTSNAITLIARVLRNGTPLAGQAVAFQASGGIELNATSAVTDENGTASVVVVTDGLNTDRITLIGRAPDGIDTDMRVRACLLPDWSSCSTFLLSPNVEGITSSSTNPPTHSRSCTRADCSEAAVPSDPHSESTASWTGPSGAAK